MLLAAAAAAAEVALPAGPTVMCCWPTDAGPSAMGLGLVVVVVVLELPCRWVGLSLALPGCFCLLTSAAFLLLEEELPPKQPIIS